VLILGFEFVLGKGKVVLVLNLASHYEGVWGDGGIVPHIL
jgi:hypothetical protein